MLGSNAFAPTDVGSKPEPGGTPIYRLARADLAVFNAEVWDPILDLEALDGLQQQLTPQEPRRREILRALSRWTHWTTRTSPVRRPTPRL